MRPTHSRARNASTMVRFITQIIQQDLKGTNFGLLTVTEGMMNKDGTLLKIFVSFFDEENRLKHFEELNKHKAFIRSSLASKMTLYKVPEIAFILDETELKARKLEEALKREADFFKNK